MKTLTLNKNRGWRGLAEATIELNDGTHRTVLFSFSQAVWDDMLDGFFVLQNEDEDYVVICFDNHTGALPGRNQQRSVLINKAVLPILSIRTYSKDTWVADTRIIHIDEGQAIKHYLANNNYHTTSKWNNVGIKVTPTI